MHEVLTPRTKPVHHTLNYSYPTSENARKLGFAKTGCYSVSVDQGEPVGYESRAQAEAQILALGTTPSLYSLDNPRYDENLAKALYETVCPTRVSTPAGV